MPARERYSLVSIPRRLERPYLLVLRARRAEFQLALLETLLRNTERVADQEISWFGSEWEAIRLPLRSHQRPILAWRLDSIERQMRLGRVDMMIGTNSSLKVG